MKLTQEQKVISWWNFCGNQIKTVDSQVASRKNVILKQNNKLNCEKLFTKIISSLAMKTEAQKIIHAT